MIELLCHSPSESARTAAAGDRCGRSLAVDGNSGVVIFFTARKEQRSRNEQCERFGHGDGEPDAVDAEKFWQKKHRGDLNDERAQERNERAGCAIVEPREERRAEDVEAADKE